MTESKALKARKEALTKEIIDFVRKEQFPEGTSDNEVLAHLKIIPCNESYDLDQFYAGFTHILFLKDDPNFDENSYVFLVPDDYSGFNRNIFFPAGPSGEGIWRNSDSPETIKKGAMIVQVVSE